MVADILDNPEKIIRLIAEKGGMPLEMINEKIRAKQEKYGGLLTEAGAAYSLAKELGIEIGLKKDKKIKEIKEGDRNINLVVTVKHVYPVHKFKKDDRQGHVQNVIVEDGERTCQLVLWNREEKIKPGQRLRLEGVYVKKGNAGLEIHLGVYGKVNIKEDIEYTKLSMIKEKSEVNVRAKIKSISSVHKFERGGEIRKVRSAIIADDTTARRFVLWGDSTSVLDEFVIGDEIEIRGAWVKSKNGELELHHSFRTEVGKPEV